MTKGNYELRPATAADLRDWYGEAPKRSCRAWVIAQDGKLVALAGYSFEPGYILVFSEVRGEHPKFATWKYAKKLFANITKYRLPMRAVANPDIPGSDRFLERLGFEFEQETDIGKQYLWRP
jgi:hypothetical protein